MATKRKDEAAPVEDAATAEATTDYTHRAGGYVLTPYGWVLEDKPAESAPESEAKADD